ncbi:hypothetical protein COW38_04540 [Candidatus Collierbacteria bacterium CG17_big_fil_post_rev_8_21_14_2_50_45_7]|uniref:Uncharacterized protein n=2 Tax=Candidatus Collieribacteriota TaxID=1752725 RepID=A0A2H0WZV3_9BACT|nr:MAG: hypothetical protein COT54_00965 [Candidatus Collierbacteria bacterium CG09_land_8_20_14_0_10_46_12]PIW06663.1 MAG: hypothetical protein COW38_04540 [Candidatus Collierbacteria bacterium CG17_big_fil_post_rev_8_21_14_2_50_45_7]
MAKTLTKSQVGIFAEKIMDWGNLAFVGLVIGQLVPGTNQVKSTLLLFGFLGILLAYSIAYLLLKRK